MRLKTRIRAVSPYFPRRSGKFSRDGFALACTHRQPVDGAELEGSLGSPTSRLPTPVPVRDLVAEYERRQPEQTLLHQVVREQLETLFAQLPPLPEPPDEEPTTEESATP